MVFAITSVRWPDPDATRDGRRDRQAALGWSEFLAEELPHASLRIEEDGGHFSTLINNAAQILTAIASDS